MILNPRESSFIGCLLIVLAAVDSSAASALAPNSCSFLTVAAVAGAIGQPVTGGNQSVVNDSSSSTSICMYRAGGLVVSLSVNQLPSAAAARAEFREELSNSPGQGEENSAQKTIPISGVGEGAFYAVDGPAIEMTGVRGSFVIGIALVGNGATAVPQEGLRNLLQTALSRS